MELGLFLLLACVPCLVSGNSGDAAAASAASAASAAAGGGGGAGGAGAAAAAAASAAAASGTGGAVSTAAASSATTSVSSSPPTSVHHIICPCDKRYAPVCGSNGVTYSNECVLRCVSQYNCKHGGSEIYTAYKGKCVKRSCDCPKKVEPICGTNNQTYINDCFRKCENIERAKYHLPLVGFKYAGYCKKATCVCPNTVIPVCGSNGKTYRNICLLQCYSRMEQMEGRPPIYFDCEGPCKVEKCVCPAKEDKVCASDRRTYYNYCAFNCENWRRHQLGLDPLIVKYPGECINCMCTADINPVCASDGNTYSNPCWLLCENKKRRRQGKSPLTVCFKGSCNCGCDRSWKPICASDHNTWPNICQLNCENRKRACRFQKKLTVLYNGVCKSCGCKH